jgi:hypothetical protein
LPVLLYFYNCIPKYYLMKKCSILLLFLLSITGLCRAQSYFYDGRACIDNRKNINLIGEFQDSITFKNTVIHATPFDLDPEFILAHCDSDMNLIWSRKLLNERCCPDANFHAARVVNDAAGDIIVAMAFNGTMYLAPGVSVNVPVVTFESEGIVVAKYDTGGNLLWYHNTTGQTKTNGLGLGVDTLGSVYLSSSFSGNISIGTDTLFASGTKSYTFFARFDSAGNLLWFDKISGKKVAADGVTDPYGNMYVAARCSDTQICGTAISTDTARRIGTVSIGATGSPNWQQFIKGPVDGVTGIGVGNDGAGVIVGPLTDTARFNTLPMLVPVLPISWNRDQTLICKYNADGSERWAKKTKEYKPLHVAIDGDRNIYIAGQQFAPTGYIDIQTVTLTGHGQMNVVKLDTNGTVLCQLSMQSTPAPNIMFDKDNFVYLYGRISSHLWYYAGTDSARVSPYNTHTPNDYYFVKADRNCRVQWINLLGTSFQSPESVKEIAQNTTLHLFPNPAADRLQVLLPVANSSTATVTLYDMSGAAVFTVSSSGNSFTLDTHRLAAGMHIVRVITLSGTYWGKFTKE